MGNLKIWEQDVVIPTYETCESNKNPMFLEKRVYQGSSGKVYPLPVIDKIFDDKIDKTYRIVFLENEYIQIQIMPELGGRIYRALDKTNNYDFVYYNRVIKPALVGLTGPWVSGGIEFNWPQHHRPNTFGPVEYLIEDRSPEKVILWVSETDRIYGTKVTTGFMLYPGKSYIEISGLFYNPTSEPQSFLWWANPAVSVHDETQSIFPPDVNAVMDHGKRDVSRFPISTSTYYKMDYSAGVDISRYKNIPVPTSYMAYKSDFDFIGGYDYKARAGILHIADHHIAPGKKQWTWGCGEFGQSWDRNLTDEDGPYIELMTGVYTDNQPDFTWLQPYEEKRFTQYFMPYKEVGEVKNASLEAAIGLQVSDDRANLTVYATGEYVGASVVLKGAERIYIEEITNISPTCVFTAETNISEGADALSVEVRTASGRVLVEFKPKPEMLEPIPDPAQAIGPPESLPSAETLYLAGLHLEQYRHAAFMPEDYYLEGLRRDKDDIRLNNAYGNLLMRRGNFRLAERHFRAAIKTLTRHNANPRDGESFYNLGKVLQYQGRLDEAFDSYFRSIWDGAQHSRGYLKLSQIASVKGDFTSALEYAERSLSSANRNYKARNIKAAILRKLGRIQDAEAFVNETLACDPMDFFARSERAMLNNQEKATLCSILRDNPHNYINLAESYAEIGFFQEASTLLEEYAETGGVYPMIYYYLADYKGRFGNATEIYERARRADTSYCFPNMLRDMLVLKKAIGAAEDWAALYYLGNFMYDKREYETAIECWERSIAINHDFPTTHRNLALAFANKRKDLLASRKCLETAFDLDKSDSRVFYELIELYKKMKLPKQEILSIMEGYPDLIHDRDDLFIEYVTAVNYIGDYNKTLALLLNRKFHPWEGGEGKVPTRYIEARIGTAKGLIAAGQYTEAVNHLEEAKVYRKNFGEGKLKGAQENNINYYLGEAYSHIDAEKATEFYLLASSGLSEPTTAIYYNDQPPHMLFYQGMALKALRRESEARSKFNVLISYGEKNIFKKQKIDYFAVSLPDFLVFDSDLDQLNEIHCNYMMALGYLGLGNIKKALNHRDEVLRLDPNHDGIKSHFAENRT